jgi:hypothetical protein
MVTLAEETIPDNVPRDRVMDFDMYAPAGIEHGYHEAWSRLQPPDTPNLVWTARNGGHWIAMRGKWVREIYSDTEHCDFSRDSAQNFLINVFMALAALPEADAAILMMKLASDVTRPAAATPTEKATVLDQANNGFFD